MQHGPIPGKIKKQAADMQQCAAEMDGWMRPDICE